MAAAANHEEDRVIKRIPYAAASAVVLVWLGTAAAAVPAAAQTPPAPRELIDRHIEAMGGRDALLARTGARMTGRFEMPAAGLSGRLVLYTRAPNQQLLTIEIPGVGEIRNGFDGTVGWSVDPFSGPRVMEGEELERMKEEAQVTASLRDERHFRSMETVERAEFDGRACWKVRLVWQSGRETTDCYAVDTGLLLATVSEQVSPMGRIEVTTIVQEYGTFDGTRAPTRTVQRMLGQEQVLIVEHVEYVPVDAAVFELPAEIRALLSGRN
jgi:hypothetical protein